jgi:predicted nucleic acid-binding protein
VKAVVLDASAFVDAIAQPKGIGRDVSHHLEYFTEWFVPEGFELEVAHALRGITIRGVLNWEEYGVQVNRLSELPVTRVPASILLDRVATLGRTIGAYDAAFVALAELLHVPLLTSDARLTRASGPRCEFLLVGPN